MREPSYEPAGGSEVPATDLMIARLVTKRMAEGDQDGFGVRAWARPSSEGWLLNVEVRQPAFGGAQESSRTYETRTDLYMMFDWYVEKLGLEEQPMLTEDMPDRVVDARLELLEDTATDLHKGEA